MRKIRKFRAMQGIGHLGIVGAVLVFLGGDAWGQTPSENTAPGATSSAQAPPEKAVHLKFFNADWPTILNKVAEESGSTLVMHEIPPGRMTRRDKTPFTRHEAVQILNHALEPEGFRILAKNQFLIVLHQRSLRTRYRRPERPSQPEWQPDNTAGQQFEKVPGYKRSVTPIATREQFPEHRSAPAPIQLASDAKPVPPPAPREQPHRTVPASPRNPLVAPEIHPAVSTSLPAGWSQATLNPRNNVRDLAGTLYKVVIGQAELLDAGIKGLPSFRMSFPPTKQNPEPGGYEVGIDLEKNQIVMASTPDRLRQLTSLFQVMDRETNAFQNPIRLMAADEATTQLAQQLHPQLKRIAREAAKAKLPPADRQKAGQPGGKLPPDWALAQAQPNPPNPNQPQPNPNPPNQGTQVVPIQPPSGLQAVIANFRGDVQIQAIPELGIMILKGNQADVDALISIIKQIQEQTKGVTPDVDVLLLENLNSTALAELLRSVYEQLAAISTRNGQPQQRVAFIPIVRPNAVMILAPQIEIDSIRKLAIQLDQPIDPTANVEVFYLKHATATQAAATLTAALQGQAAQAAPGGGGGATAATPGASLEPRLQVVPDVRTNSLIVQARPNDMREVALILSKIDLNYSPAVNKMQVVPLKNAVADELANVITSTLLSLINPGTVTGTPPAGQVNNQIGGQGGQAPQELRDTKSMILEFLSSVGDQEQIVRSGLLLDVRITPDIRSNSLIVTAPDQSMEMIVALIHRLDQPSSTVAEIKVFTLENADAASMLELLLTLFEQDDANAAPGVQIVGAEDASSGLVPLRFSTDVRTNSIIAIGGGDALRVVEAILLRLDESDVRERKTTVVKLRNSPATEIAAAINTFLQSQRDLVTIDPELVSNTELLEREIIAVAEPVSNSLLISATPRYYEEVQDLIKKLDAEPPQVIIQALLVEVALDNTDEFGVELGFQDDILFDRSTSTLEDLTLIDQTFTSPNGVQTTQQQIVSQTAQPGFRFNDPSFTPLLGNNINSAPQLLGGQSLSNFSLGRVNNDLGFGGLVLSASSNQVSFLLRALAARRQVHILSRPQIRTLDNQVAQIQVGQQVPIVNGIQFGGANNSAYPIVIQDSAGIILTVTPRISPEENIVMEVVAEKSAFTGAGVPIFVDTTTGNEITSPIKDITTARTTVGVPNGQTIVLGGMITKNDETIERKVPWLADLPYLGLPFRYDSTRTRRTELLIFLTPRVIRGDADNELIKQVESERMHFVEQEAEEIHGPIFEVPGRPGLNGWMQGPEFCPPGMEGTPSWDGPPSDMEMPVPPLRNPIPAPAPAGPPAGPDFPNMPMIPDKNMSWKQVDPKPIGSVPPAGGVVNTSASGPPLGGVQQGMRNQPAQSGKKRPWYSFGKR